MPVYRAPRNDISRLACLQHAYTAAQQDVVQTGDPSVITYELLSPETVNALKAILPQFETAYNNVAAKLGLRAKEVEESEAALDELKTYLRDLWEVMRRRVHRRHEPVAVLNFYRLTADGHLPSLKNRQEWLAMAEAVIQGDAEAVAAGYEAAFNPSTAELQAILETARQEVADIDLADKAHDQAQEALALLRPQADEIIQEVIDELRFALRKQDAPSQRRIMRRYGARFHYLPDETPDADEPDA